MNYWDPHTPYRAPAEFQKAFADAPIPAWMTEEVRQQHWNGVGPHSAREINGYEPDYPHLAKYPWQPRQASHMEQVRRMFDGYDAGILYADHHAGMVLNALADQKVLDETVIIMSSDHGECLGELNVYGDHQTPDRITTRVPMILLWPGVTDVLAGGLDGHGSG